MGPVSFFDALVMLVFLHNSYHHHLKNYQHLIIFIQFCRDKIFSSLVSQFKYIIIIVLYIHDRLSDRTDQTQVVYFPSLMI